MRSTFILSFSRKLAPNFVGTWGGGGWGWGQGGGGGQGRCNRFVVEEGSGCYRVLTNMSSRLVLVLRGKFSPHIIHILLFLKDSACDAFVIRNVSAVLGGSLV